LRWALALAFCLPALAQVTVGSVSGYVLDPDHRPIPQAVVTASDPARGTLREVRCDASGFYRIDGLPPATYRVRAAADRFRETEEQVRVEVESRLRLDLGLPLTEMRQAVTVRAQSSPLQSESADLGAVLDEVRISLLPLNQRDVLELALLTPGVMPPVQNSELSTRGSFAMNANGGREDSNNYLLDGVDDNDPNINRYVIQPPVDLVQEFRIATNSYQAEYGRNSGAQVTVITRSGSKEFHGVAYEYLRNRLLDAGNYFESQEPAKYVRNQFGMGVGGPLRRSGTFFFANLDGLREREGQTQLGVVPTDAMRAGDFSGTGTVIRDPFTQAPFSGNRIAPERFSPLAAKLFAMYPRSNLTGPGANYESSPVLSDDLTQASVRVDHRITAADQLTLRYTFGNTNLAEPFAEDSTSIPGYGDILHDHGHNALVREVHVFDGAVNSFSLGFNRAPRQLLPANGGVDVNRLWGVSYLPQNPAEFGYPAVNVQGFSPVGDVTSLPINRVATTYLVSDSVAWTRGTHGFKAGVQLSRSQMNGLVDLLSRGSISFSGAMTGSGAADLLLGFPTFALQARVNNPQHQRIGASAAYFQDEWKARPSFTLNLGLRYEYDSPMVDAADQMTLFDAAARQLKRVGSNGVSRSGFSPSRNNFAPRLGVAWKPAANLVVRAGYGLYYDAGTTIVNSSLYFNPPYFTLRVFFPSTYSLLNISDPFPANGGYTPPASLTTLSPDLNTAYAQHWNVSVQSELHGSGTLTAAYAGSKGTHLIRSRDINQPKPGPGGVSGRAPYQGFSNIMMVESGSNSNYHSLQASFNRPLARGLSLLASYTLSKSIDDTSAFLSTIGDKNFPQDSSNFRAERAVSSFDVHQRATLAYSYALPGRQRWTRGWELRGIVAAQTGQPFTPLLQFDNSNTGNTGGNFGSDRPNLLSSPAVAHPSPQKWFNTSAFAIPAPYTFGNAGRNILRGPGLVSVDASLARRFRIGDRAALIVEAQAFNLLNRTNFDLPQNYADDPTSFGEIFSAKAPRQAQFAVRLQF
jgi:hypothetical protein